MSDVYDMVVIGAGAGGLTAAAFAGELGAKVAMIERDKLGGDCTWRGCVPSKALLKVGKIAHAMRTADHYGIAAAEPVVDMAKVRDYVQNTIEEIYQHETPEVFADRGVETIIGEGRFIDANTVQVGDRQLKAKKIVIATGARAAIPPIHGLEDVPYKTNENLFSNDRLPEHLMIIGGGPIGMEMAQAYARLGSRVTVMDAGFWQWAEPETAEVMVSVLEYEGITFARGLVESVRMGGEQIIATQDNGHEVEGDMLLVAVGRTPNVEHLDLEKAGIQYSKDGIWVDKYLRTSQEHIFALGDCIEGPKFTHRSGAQGSVVGRNAIFPVVNYVGHDPVMPTVMYTDPEVAQVGLTEAEAREKYGDAVKVFYFPMTEGDRANADNDTAGFIKMVYRGSSDILGVTIVAARAGEMIIEFEFMMKKKLKPRDVIEVIHAYPTYSEIVRKAIGLFTVKGLFEGVSGQAINLVKRVLF